MAKMETQVILISAVLLCLFLSGGLTTKAASSGTSIDSLNYPATIKIGKTLEIDVVFDYSSDQDCLYGNCIRLLYVINDKDNAYTDFFNQYEMVSQSITDITGFPKPEIVTITITIDTLDLEYFNYEEGDIFLFKVRYVYGIDSGGQISPIVPIFSEFYEITSIKKASTSTVIIVVPLLILSTTVLIRKKKLR